MKQLFFVRHGLTDANVAKIFSGDVYEAKLTEEGVLQAKQAGQDLNQNGHMFDFIIASPTLRTRHTAEYIATEVGYPIDKIEYDDLLVERKFGPLEGISVEEYFASQGKTYKDLDDHKGVETTEDMQKRAEQALTMLKVRPEDKILVVSHGAFGRALRRVVNSQPHSHEYSDEEVRIGNCEIVELI